MVIFEILAPSFKYLFSLCFLFACVALTAQDPHPAFKQYTVEDGLPSSKVYQVKQDSKGYMWFATDNGVSRFNGYEFEHFSLNNGLPDNTVFEIFEDKKGKIWFVTLTNKLFYYEHDKMHLYPYNHLIDNIEGDHVKTSFAVAENGSVFLGLYRYGIIEITKQGELKKHTEHDSLTPVVTVIEPVLGSLIYYDNSFNIKERRSIKLETRFLTGTKKVSKDLYNLHPSSRFIRLKNKNIAFSYDNELFIIDGLTTEVKQFNERINWIYEDSDSDLWIGTYMGGVYYIENGDFEHKKNYLKELFITGITQDNQGGFWFTTEGNSVYYTPSKKILTYDVSSGLKDARINCLAADTEGIYLGLQRPLIHKITRSGLIKSYEFEGENKAISSLVYSNEESGLWFSGNVVSGFMGRDGKTQILEFSFKKMLVEKLGAHWIINSNGLCHFVNGTSRVGIRPKIKRMNGIIRKDKSTLLIGAIDGLWEYTIATQTCKHSQPENLLLRNHILDIVSVTNGSILLATKNAGLLVMDKDEKVSQFSHDNGLSSNNVNKILVDGPVIWLATDKGLNKMIMDRGNVWQVKTYTTNDGLISNEVYDIIKFNHNIWVATDKGLSFFDPDMSVSDVEELPLYIKQIVVNDNSKEISDHYGFTYDENNIKIRFIAVSYKNSRKQQYRYRMLGLNSRWNYTKEREIQYTTLPPGTYKFVVSVLKDDGKWGREVSFEFTVATPFWKSWWFLTLSVITAIGILYAIINYWNSRKHWENNREEEINKLLLQLKLKALRAQMNPHFIFNVINSIQHFILHNNVEAAHRYLSKFSKLIRAILNNSEKNRISLSEEIKALNLYLELEDMRFENRFEYEIEVAGTIDVNATFIPSMLIQPYVENAVKHGMSSVKSTGKIKITIVRHGEFLKCIIEDNGVGRKFTLENKNSNYRSFGNSITKERLAVINQLYHNQLSEKITDLYDSEGNAVGTKIEIYIPYA